MITKFHWYILCSLVCFIGLFDYPKQVVFYLLFATIMFFIFAMVWAYKNRE